MNSDKRTKVRIIVLDGVDWKFCNERPELVPELFTIAKGPHGVCGCCAMLRACEAPITPCAVCALLTGRDDGNGWFSEDRYATSLELLRTRPWFHEAARYGLTIGLCNVPMTWPAFPMPRGSWLTSGFPIDRVAMVDPNRPWHWPSSLDARGYPIEQLVLDTGPGGTKDLGGLRRAEEQIVDWHLNAAPRADIEFVWLRSTDSAGHHYWGTRDYDDTLRHASILAGKLANSADAPENVIVISDHGFDALESPRCEAYNRTSHGPAASRARLAGGHSEEGVFFARGDRIFARGLLREQKLVDVAGGLFDLLQIPPPEGMRTGTPDWSSPVSADEAAAGMRALAELGY